MVSKTRIKKKTGKKIRDFAKQRRATVVKEFSKKILDKFGPIVKAIIVWGSTARDQFRCESDIDLVILIDDTKKGFNNEIREKIDEFISEAASKVDEKLSPQPVWTITEFMRMVKNYAPLAYALLKDGIPVYDTGFFVTNKNLLEMGEMPATPEASERRMESVPKRLLRAKQAKLWLIAEDLYYAMIGAEEAVMMYLGRGPPDPINAAQACREYLVKTGLIEEKYANLLDEVVKFRKDVEHRKISEIKGEEVDKYLEKGEEFVERMKKLLFELSIRRKQNDIQQSYELMIKASVAALKALNKLPEDPKELPEAFKKYLIEEGKISPVYEEVLGKILEMKRMMKEKKLEEVPEREIHITKEYVRRFIGNVREIFKEIEMDKSVPEIPIESKPEVSGEKKKESKHEENDEKLKKKEKSKIAEESKGERVEILDKIEEPKDTLKN